MYIYVNTCEYLQYTHIGRCLYWRATPKYGAWPFSSVKATSGTNLSWCAQCVYIHIYDSFIRVTWRISLWLFSYLKATFSSWCKPGKKSQEKSFWWVQQYVTWFVNMCDVTHLRVSRNVPRSYIFVTWLVHMAILLCGRDVWGKFIVVCTSVPDVISSRLCRDSFTYAMWPIRGFDVTR